MQSDRGDVPVHLRPTVMVALVVLVLVLGLAPASSGGTEAVCRGCTPIAPPPPGKVIARVSFAAGKPRAWKVFSGSSVARDGKALTVTTTTGRYAYVLDGPPFAVSPGKYSVRLYGNATDGGVTVGVLAVTGPPWGWLGYADYAAHEARMGQLPLSASFSVQSRTKVRIMLANFSRRGKSSSWTLQRLAIVRNS